MQKLISLGLLYQRKISMPIWQSAIQIYYISSAFESSLTQSTVRNTIVVQWSQGEVLSQISTLFISLTLPCPALSRTLDPPTSQYFPSARSSSNPFRSSNKRSRAGNALSYPPFAKPYQQLRPVRSKPGTTCPKLQYLTKIQNMNPRISYVPSQEPVFRYSCNVTIHEEENLSPRPNASR